MILDISTTTLGRHKRRNEGGHGIQQGGRQSGTQCSIRISVQAWIEQRIECLDKMPNQAHKGKPVVSQSAGNGTTYCLRSELRCCCWDGVIPVLHAHR